MKNHPIRAVGGVLLALVLTGCWPQQGGGPANTRVNRLETELTREDAASLSEHWRTPIDSIITEPIVAGGQLYTTNRAHDDGGSLLDVLGVQAYDPATGGLIWERSLLPTEGDPVAGGIETPAFVDGALWVPYSHDGLAGCGGELVRLDPATGAVLSADPTGRYPSAVVAADSIVAYTEVHCGGGVRLVVRDQQTRAIRWSHTFTVGGSGATPTIAGGRVFLRIGDTLQAFALSGCGASVCGPLWTEHVPNWPFGDRPIAGPAGSLITIGAPSAGAPHTVIVRDARTGAIRWQAEPRYTGTQPGAITGVAVAGDTVYVAGARGGGGSPDNQAILDAYAAGGCGEAVCAPTWTAELGETRPARAPTVAGGVVYVPLVAGSATAPAVAAVDAGGCGSSACGELGRVPLVPGPGPFIEQAQPYVTSVAEGRLFVGWLPSLHGSTLSELVAVGSPPG